ncbi:hypothetical protein [Buchnera aphidicola]|uniref:hypothetical protein n=1 Tax=Buchnera aphidicola TaxID=9 RepID=UPI0016518A5D|nr:hypothetical protein [Buchnera aphidicola]
MNKYFFLIFYVMFFLNGCHVSNHINDSIIQKNNTNLILLDFDTAIENIITKITQSKNISFYENTLFFVDVQKNNTNLIFNEENLINLIKKKLFQKNKNIYFLEKKIIEENKKKLGILNINNHLDNNVSMLLARQNHVKYYLNSTILDKNNSYEIKVELVLVKTGEIMFTKTEKLYYLK